MKIEDLLALCQRYGDMGWAVQEQLASVIDGEALEDQNSNALEMIARFLRDCARVDVDGAKELAEDIKLYLTKQAAE